MEPSESRGASASSSGKKKSWLRWLIPRFSLRTLLVLVFLCAVALGIWVERSERQRRICKQMEALGIYPRLDELPAYLKRLPPSTQRYGDGHYLRNMSELRVRPDNVEEVLRLAAGLPCLTKLYLDHREPTSEAARMIGALTRLRELEATSTTIDDEAVSHWTGLQRLEKLNLSIDHLSDEGCRHVAKLSRLRELNLNSNVITDAGAGEIAKLRNLENLTIGRTYITDRSVKQFAGLSKLETLDLSETRVTTDGVRALAALPNLKKLRLSGTDIDDSCIDILCQLPKLEELWIDETLCSPQVLIALGRKASLKRLDARQIADLGQAMQVARALLDQGKFSWANAAQIMGDGNLHEFLLGRTNEAPPAVALTNQLLAKEHWARLGEAAKSYGTLNFSGTNLDDEDLAHFREAIALTSLAVADTQVTDERLATIAKMAELTSLDLSGTRVTDKGLAHLAGLKKLETLILNRTQVTDAGLAHLQGLTRLIDLQLNETQVTTTGVQTLTSLTKLKTLLVPRPEEFFQSRSPHAIWPSLEFMSPPGPMHIFRRRPGGYSDTPDMPTWSLPDATLNFGLPVAGSGIDLTVHHLDLTDEICREIAAEKTLQYLRLYQCGLDDRRFELLLPHDELIWLDLTDAAVTDESIDRLLKFRNLWVLKVNGTKITPQGLARLLGSSKVSNLELSTSQLNEIVLEALAGSSVETIHIIGDVPPLETFKAISSIEKMKFLNFYPEGVKRQLDRQTMDLLLGKSLQPSTTQIGVSGPYFNDEVCAKIGDYRLLSSFYARRATITNRTIERLGECRFLRHFEFKDMNVTTETLDRLPQFQYLANLKLSGCDIDDDDLRHLAGLQGLKQLSLNRNPITDESIDTLATMTRLREVRLFRTKCTNQGLARLRERLPHCKVVTTELPYDN